MSGNQLVRGCAPTLAGIKTANLFSAKCDSINEAETVVREWNRQLGPKGVCAKILQFDGKRALIFVFRVSHLTSDLRREEVQKYLGELGYNTYNLSHCISHLSGRIRNEGEFPHEIGLFLGYPVDDVKAFIKNKGKGFKCSGLWKVYSNEEEAIKIFEKYRKCTRIYCMKFQEGFSLGRLTVAGNGLQ